jgi:hypothetical protein
MNIIAQKKSEMARPTDAQIINLIQRMSGAAHALGAKLGLTSREVSRLINNHKL